MHSQIPMHMIYSQKHVQNKSISKIGNILVQGPILTIN